MLVVEVISIWTVEMFLFLGLKDKSCETAALPLSSLREPTRIVYDFDDSEKSLAIWKPMPWFAPENNLESMVQDDGSQVRTTCDE
jgi:hypothetical protein